MAATVAARACWRHCAPCTLRRLIAAPTPFTANWQAAHSSYKRGFSSSTRHLEKKYTEAHEWVELSSDGKTGTIGITAYAATQLGDVVYVELPAADLSVKAGDALGAVESVKSASDIYAPVSGTVVETNSELEDKPGTINKSPEADGWIAKLTVGEGAAKEMESMMDKDAYKAYAEE